MAYPTSQILDAKVDDVTDVLAVHVNQLQTATVQMSLLYVKNTSAATVAANDLGYIDDAGEFKLTTTAYLNANWAVVVVGGANNADIVVAVGGSKIVVILNGNCSAGDFLYTSTTTKQAQPQTYMRPEMLAIATTANSSGAGGTCEAVLQCNTTPRGTSPSNDLYAGTSLSDSDFVSTIATLPGGAVLTYGAVTSGDEANLVPISTSQLAKMVLHNTTRASDALISNCVTGTNTVTLTASVPGAWQVGDTITARSQTNTSNPTANVYFIDFEITATVNELARHINTYIAWRDSGAANLDLNTHPYETNANSKRRAAKVQVANVFFNTFSSPIPLIQSRFCMSWGASGANTANYIVRLALETVAAP